LNRCNACLILFLQAQDKQGMRPIHMATTHKQESICSMLLEAGCEIRCQDNEKLTPLHCATTEGRQILTVFSKFKKISTVANDNLETVKIIYWIHKLAFDRGDSSLEDLCCICFQP
jgi:ankyrin repeat protein